MRGHGIAVRPTRVVTQIKGELGVVRVWRPPLRDGRNRLACHRIVLGEPFVKRQVDTRFRLTSADLWIEGFGLRAADVPEHLPFRRLRFAEVLRTLRVCAARRSRKQEHREKRVLPHLSTLPAGY